MFPPTHFLNIHFYIILPSLPWRSKWPPSLKCPHHNPVCYSPLHHTHYRPSPSHSSWFDHPKNIWGGVQTIRLRCYLVLLRPKNPPQHPILRHPQPTFFPQCKRPSFTPITNNSKLQFCVLIINSSLISKHVVRNIVFYISMLCAFQAKHKEALNA